MTDQRTLRSGAFLLKSRRLVLPLMLGSLVAVSLGAAVTLDWSTVPTVGANPHDPSQASLGRSIYAKNCAACHGANLEGQADWRIRKPAGRLPAPPHDENGHTWHHSDQQLFEITKSGLSALVPGYETDMPSFADTLSDEEIWAVLAYIKSTWPPEVQLRQDRRNQGAEQ